MKCILHPFCLRFSNLLCIDDMWIRTYVCEYSHMEATMYVHACACMGCVGIFTHTHVTYVCVGMYACAYMYRYVPRACACGIKPAAK